MAAMFLPAYTREKSKAFRIQCVNNLKQSGLAFRVSPGGCGDQYLIRMSTNQGGTMEFASGPNEFRHFLVMSNELSTPKVLFCPAETDRRRIQANTFSPMPKPGEISFTSNSNLSYFVGINATETDPQGILSGDRNITNGTPIKTGILDLLPNQPAGFAAELHGKVGNIALADGSIQQLATTGLRAAITKDIDFTNRLQMPILSP